MLDLSVPVAERVNLHLRHWLGGRGRPFLLVHGLASNARLWDEVAEVLVGAGHPVYAVDLRGHGDSDVPADGYDNATVVADLVEFAAVVVLDGFIVAGHSWGGNLAVRLAAQFPQLVAGLVLVDGGWIDLTSTMGSWEECAAVAAQLRPPIKGATADGMRKFLRAVNRGVSEAAIEAKLADMRQEPDGTLSYRLSEQQYLSILRSMYHDPPARWHPEVSVPTLLLPAQPTANQHWGRWARGWVEQALATLPDASVRWYDNADHDLHAQHPQRLAGDLLDLARAVG